MKILNILDAVYANEFIDEKKYIYTNPSIAHITENFYLISLKRSLANNNEIITSNKCYKQNANEKPALFTIISLYIVEITDNNIIKVKTTYNIYPNDCKVFSKCTNTDARIIRRKSFDDLTWEFSIIAENLF